jgi:hypothetical protein
MLRSGRSQSGLPTTSGAASYGYSYNYGRYAAASSTTSSGSSTASDNYGSASPSAAYSYSYNGYASPSYDNGYSESLNSNSPRTTYSNDIYAGEYKDKPLRSNKSRAISAMLKQPYIWAALCMVALFGSTMKYRSQYHYILKELRVDSPAQVLDNFAALQKEKEKWHEDSIQQKKLSDMRVKRMEDAYRQAQQERDDLRTKADNSQVQKEHDRLVVRDQAWIRQVVRLQHAITTEAKRSVEEK